MALSAGSSLGPYEIVSQVGAGGMGEVYKARDTRLGRTVAIKVLPPGAVTAEHRARLLQEARTVSNLNHPNIVTLFDVGEQSGTDYLVLEFVPGRTLDQLIPAQGMPLAHALKIAIAVANAVSSAHAAGVLHRDLKPANVMINDSGAVKVLDFGLAKSNAPEAPRGADAPTLTMPDLGHSRPGTIAGTPAYMSPEQAEGRKLDTRSDVFSFGAMLYEMLTGQKAFQGESTASILASVLREQPRPVRQVIPAIPMELERLLDRCLRKDPARRMSSLHDVKVELEDILADPSPVSAAPAAAAPNRRWIGWAAAACVAIAAAGWHFSQPRGPRGPMKPPAPVPLTAYAGDEVQPAFSADGNQVAFAWNGPEQDNFDIYVKVVGSAEPLRLTKDPAIDFAPVWSPDGKSIYFLRRTDAGNALYRVPPLGGSEVRVAATKCAGDLSWIAGSDRLLCEASGAKGLEVISVSKDGGDERLLANGCTPSISLDGGSLLFSAPCDGYSDIFLAGLDSEWRVKGSPRKISTEKMSVYGIRWEEDGRNALAAMGTGMSDSRLHVVQPGSGMIRALPLAENSIRSITIAPTGRIAYSNSVRVRHIWQIENGKASLHPSSSTQVEYSPSFSPDGKRIAFESTRSGSQQIWITDADGSRPTELTSGGRANGTARWSPDGRWIVFDRRTEDGQTAIFAVESAGGKPRQLTSGDVQAVLPSFSNDGKWIYFTAHLPGGGVVCRVPFEGGPHDVHKAQRVSQPGADVSFEAADGKSIYYVGASDGKVRQAFLAGGPETELPFPASGRALTVRPEGIYFMYTDGSVKPPVAVLSFFDVARKQGRELARVTGSLGGGLTVSPDRKVFLFTKAESPGSDISVVERIRPDGPPR